MNTFGTLYRLTDFGESHGTAIGGIIDGIPAGIGIDLDAVQAELDRRRPGQSTLTTQRNEADKVNILSGLYQGLTLGTPIGFTIANSDHHSSDYDNLKDIYRPGHADYTYEAKYGLRDHRGGGRASARETAVRVVGGAFARQILEREGILISAYTSAIGQIQTDASYRFYSTEEVDSSPVRCPDKSVSVQMEDAIREARSAGDTLGGIVSCVVHGVPAGLGEPVFGKLQAMLASAMMSINAAKGFEYGDGFAMAGLRGSEVIDMFSTVDGSIRTTANHSGGIQGGISNGADITFRVAFKPIATMMRPLDTVDRDGNATTFTARGRHDICVVPRAVPVVEAMTAMTLLDALLLHRSRKS